ncbi:iron-containing alcohol dehydrogenase [Enterococcus saccharolyticus]|uniref:NADH-dependent butanol dehydrogenase A n=1 Tax=Enterococcus saccharolyticus subsp. saccharolyticus ATCC 43076 TaxID=1139996 RepID=S0P321_9ENTE|nr:iron-containing alcohol dehydrogenase [Enterococcus saccharolyticus]EOT25682.1 NADH-dependent butanol dehydrogenase A [Enterococcus saccharolyticus subsp. saccharolyticus ATCC 43076]EOT83208.1 NADH-dependent butanol dehydrogenase A [Enterococcus saccharolyticus subsp. saccharolyticus ATCC 43076]OJG90553.1 NADH-dependent butanol dehydrogenase A [Enterococcus saccharolyticus]
MENFNFHVATDIRFGKDRLSELPEVINTFGKNVLLVYGGGSIKQNGLYDKVRHALQAATVVELAGVEPNPRIETVTKGAALCREHHIDVILAVGGGSVIDCSKAIAGGAYVEGDLWENLVLKRQYNGPAIPIVTILTLAATGSEMNRGGVISNMQTQQKLGMGGKNLLPKVSFLDPTNTFTVNAYQTAAGSADIFSHLMENYFNATPGTDVQDGVAEGLMKTVIHHLPIALKEPENYDARANLMWASTLALNGLTGSGKTGTWSCHAMEHELSAFYDITHGIGLAILTPRWMAHILNETTVPKFARFAKEVWGIQEENPEQAARKGIQALYDFFLENGVPMTLPEVGIDTEKDFDQMAQQAIAHSTISKAAFVPLQKEDVIQIYQASQTPSTFI